MPITSPLVPKFLKYFYNPWVNASISFDRAWQSLLSYLCQSSVTPF